MRIDRPAILRHVQFLQEPEVMQRARSLLLEEDAWSVGENLPPVKVEDILRLWRIRRKNAEITKHRILGIDLLIDSLARLPLGLDLSLFGFSSERTAGIFFFTTDTLDFVGLVISAKLEAAVQERL